MIGLWDIDSKIPNLALMKISAYYKSLGEQVEFYHENGNYEKIYASTIFERSRSFCTDLKEKYGDKINIGGTGYDIHKDLEPAISKMRPDYQLYQPEQLAKRLYGISSGGRRLKKAEILVNAGMGFTSRGCIRNCNFCYVPMKEGKFRQASSISDILNPSSNILILHDNNLTADPYCIDKLNEIYERKITVDINQGIDIRLLDDEKAYYISKVKHLRSIHYAWDLMDSEKDVINGINILSKYVKKYRQMCFMLVGYNTTFDEDMYRFSKLSEQKIKPYIMRYNEKKDDPRLNHFARWVNSRIYTTCTFNEYMPWVKYQKGSR